MNSEPLTAFTWGYWGWGNSVPQFLEAAARAEASRGWDAPAFADVRLSRSGRAPGFRGGALGSLVGAGRYQWFAGLGNANTATHEAGVRIAEPADANLLLDFIVHQAASHRRVLFFCACRVGHCHRHTVATLLLDVARGGNVALDIMEWPGGEPEDREVRLRADKVKGGRTSVPLGKKLPQDGLATLPWGSTARVWLGRQIYNIVTGPALFKSEWVLPVIHVAAKDEPADILRQKAGEFRAEFKCEPRRVTPRHAG